MATGPDTTTPPFILANEPSVSFTSIATVGDVIDDATGYRMVGIPDGLGAFDNGDGSFTLLMNHELGATAGIVRDHDSRGAFVSRLVIDKATLEVISADDAIQTVRLWNDALNTFNAPGTTTFVRFCSSDLAAPSAFAFTENGTLFGTTERIYLTGEEAGAEGRAFGTVVTGSEAGIAYELSSLGLFSWENAVASPFAQKKTIVVETDDSGGGQVYVYVGEKQITGLAVEKAGLVGGDLYGIKVTGLPSESDAAAANGAFTLVKLGADGDVSDLTGVQLEQASVAAGVTGFQRPEDIHWDPTNPARFYFVTTATFNGQSRLYQATLTDITRPELGGTIVAVLDSSQLPLNGTVGVRMMDNITVDFQGHVIIQEDVGNNAFLGRVLEYNPATDELVVLGTHDGARFLSGQPGYLGTQDEEASGVTDVTAFLGDADTKVFLMTDQVHRQLGGELVEDGQLMLMSVDYATPTDGGNRSDTIDGTSFSDTLSGNNGDDTVRGGLGHDALHGGNGDDTLDGGRNDDTLFGGNGNDALLGGAGRDLLIGGRGDDILTGGDDADRFDFSSLEHGKAAPFGSDTVTDFQRGLDQLVFAEGVTIRRETQGDFNGDGAIDTRLMLSRGGSITLLGVDDVTAADHVSADFAAVGLAQSGHELAMMMHQQLLIA